jgi:putative hydrolase of the HAD superfamily
VPLLLVDLDDTLIDRAGSFRRWATEFVTAHGGSPPDKAWLIAADRGGYEDRGRLAELISARFGLPGHAVLASTLRDGQAEHLVLDDAVPAVLDDARHAGWLPFVITNGDVPQQERKLAATGLDAHVDGWVISEGVGLRKPDPEIFRLAARRAGQPLDGAWMIGDSAEADIAGAVNAGIDSIWLSLGRQWDITEYHPTRIAATFPEAVRDLLAADTGQR